RVFGIVRRERGGKLEPGKFRAEIHELRAVAIDAVAGTVCRGITGEARIREIEAVDGRAVGAEDLRRARNSIAHRRKRTVLIAELNLAEAATEVGVDLPDLVFLR